MWWSIVRPRGRPWGGLILPPLGYEDTSAYRPLRILADALAEAGFLTLRLDWPGLGDSAGSALDEDLPLRRLEAVRAALQALREAGHASVGVVGVRAGGLLAMVEFPDRLLSRKTFDSVQSISEAIDEMKASG